MGLDHLLQAGRLAHHHVVGQHHGKGFVVDQAARAPDRMAQPHRLVLADIGDGARFHVGLAQDLEQVLLAGLAQVVFQLVRVVEVILERALAARGDKDELGDSAARASSMAYWISGRSTSVMISFGIDFVAGRKRVPRPATGKMAFVTLRVI